MQGSVATSPRHDSTHRRKRNATVPLNLRVQVAEDRPGSHKSGEQPPVVGTEVAEH
jgi:hypothetical protein